MGLDIIVIVGCGRLSALTTARLNGSADNSVNFIQLTFTNGRLLHHDPRNFLGNAAVQILFTLYINIVLIAELVNEKFRKLLTGGLLIGRAFA